MTTNFTATNGVVLNELGGWEGGGSCSPATTLGHIYQKLGLSSRDELIDHMNGAGA